MPESIRSEHSSGKIANSNTAPRVVILGAGFAGLTAAQRLAGTPVDVTVIDRHNYHLFQPLLYQVATAALSPADIATPIRGILGRHDNIEVLLDTVTGIDRDEQCVRTLSGRCIPYDYLVIATGATHSYFGNDEWAEVAPGLKRIEDATHVRRRILLAFEKAEMSDDPDERDALLTFVIVGGGPTGVEMAGAVAELARFTLARDFRHIKPGAARIILIEAGSRVLKAFPERLSERARQSLENMGVDVRLNERVTEITSRHVAIDDHRIPARTTIWGAGVQASPAGDWLNAETDRSGRIIVDSQLRVPGDDRIYALGDTACCEDANGIVSPGLAPAAKQHGKYVARHIRTRVGGQPTARPFRYRDWGRLATIGRKSAVADFGKMHLSGHLAWWLWGGAHIYFLVGFRNRLVVAANWFWSYLTFGRGIRLITGDVYGNRGRNDTTI